MGRASCALFPDGTDEVITTDETWHVRTGQIRYSEIYMGETIDTNAPDIREGKVSASARSRISFDCIDAAG